MATSPRVALSGAQVTQVRECLTRYHENIRTADVGRVNGGKYIPVQMATEDLVNDIMAVVFAEGR